jgi:hypothetical protein
LAALEWSPNRSENENVIPQSANLEEDLEEKYMAESVSTLSGEISDLEDDGLEQISKRRSQDSKPTEEEENAALRAARELFGVEEELRDEHFACLQVRSYFEVYGGYAILVFLVREAHILVLSC